ncbi:putative disease resistance protein RGA3 [Momordica charantia]|uniref:Disease resistance protein RGA3 n=1 Tax=Momordica charantia TaxID=3673 RepID=A0A6J1CVR3_MOMCH|nr:putative disease resistance protein RGA3 [Momordica charantia]XP_022145172.1 putative disease resistance protein RGA3 [Momordica charantia]XP_022145173.1 putative disease resistance protein RGA3 [Momordica charantia]XP_022145174.1 putative disease resistance protein RGA3 [Momordica charantia]XP_022145175.1 putative disease resistance protein RGA3 [Momordica charantia]
MAEFLWTFAVQEVLKKVLKLAAEQIGVAWGLDKELSKLRKRLLKAETILGDINRKKLRHESVRLWVEDLQHLVYQADDLLDELVYEDLRRKVEIEKINKVRNFFSLTNNPFLFRSKMANSMKAISETLYQHYYEASALGLVGEETTETDNKNILKQIRETTSILNFEVIGREIEVLNIVKLVIDSSYEHRMSIIPIVGMGGLGKTTLAKMVFNHELIKEHFDKSIWVCVSESFIIINILEGIFQSLTNTSSGLNYKETLLQRLQKEMQGKKYFLVLDDVWNEEVSLWGELRDCLNEIAGKSGNSIIVTTRSIEVATIMMTVPSHHIRKLSDDECWTLFKESANVNRLLMNPELEIIREVVVKKIGGIPQVAKVLGGAAKFEGNYERWVTAVESIVRNISNDDKDFVMSTLKLSVDFLPLLSLKQCFTFCSNFPKDWEFVKEALIQMWIAQGFIQLQEGDDVTLENIGEEYFNFLWSRSLFQDISKDMNGTITHFKMHDLIHDVACIISNQRLEFDPCNRSEKGVRKLRTLVINDEATIHKKLEDFVYLRVLVMHLDGTRSLLSDYSIGMNWYVKAFEVS